MFSLIRLLVVLLVCLVGIGLYRGWFSFSSPSRDAENHRVNISLSVNEDKLKSDAAKVKAKIVEKAEKVAQRLETHDDQAKAPEVK